MGTPSNSPQDRPDDRRDEELAREVCLCFHVSLSKLIHFARRNRPKVVAQMSECYGAGTGCGWCRPQLASIMEEIAANPDATPRLEITSSQYEEGRRLYRQTSGAGGSLVAGEEPLADALE